MSPAEDQEPEAFVPKKSNKVELKIIAANCKARHFYELLEFIEAGKT